MKPTPEIINQIRQIAEEKYPILTAKFWDDKGNISILEHDELYQQRMIFIENATAVMERLDIDIDVLISILFSWEREEISPNMAKQQILNATKLK